MRCRKCQRSRKRSTKAKCWRKWFLCPPCAVVEHPEEYNKNQQVLWSEIIDMHGRIRKKQEEHAGMRNPPYKPKEKEA